MRHLVTLFILLLLIPCLLIAGTEQEPLKLGVLAYRPKPQVQTQWQPVADYLQSSLSRPVELAVYNHAEINAAVAERRIDLVITTANQFILLQRTAGLSSPLATLIRHVGKNHLITYGSVIVTRSDRDDITSLADLANKRIAVVSVDAFAGYQIPSFELVEAGFPLPADEALLVTGQPHDRVVAAVREGRADVGFIRTGVLESLAEEGKLDPGQFKVINRQQLPNFPYVLSTRLYPEWPVAVMPQIDQMLASRLAATLYLMPTEVLKDSSLHLHGFGIPANYEVVDNLLRRLHLPPYDHLPEIVLVDVWHHYTGWIITLAGLLLLLALTSVGMVAVLRRSRHSFYALAEMAKKEKLILATLAEGVYGIDPQGRCIFINPRALSILGLSEEEVIGEDTHTLFHAHTENDNFYPMAKCPVIRSLHDGKKRELEDTFIHSDGTTIPVWMGVTVMRQGDKIIGAVVVFQDISERKQAEAALRQSETRHRQIVATSMEGIWVLDPDAITTFVNARMAEMLGYSTDEMIGRPMDDFLFAEDIPNHQQKMVARHQGVSEIYERRFRRQDQQTLWTVASATPSYDESHHFNGSFAMFTDITERKRDEAVNAARLHLIQFSLTHSLAELLEETLNQAEKLTGSLISFYHFVDDDQENLTLQMWSAATKAHFCKAEGEGLHYPIADAGVWVECVRERKVTIHNDYASLPHRKGLPEGHAEVIRELVAPVFRGDKISAILGVGNKAADYNDKDVEVISLIADLAWEIAERKRVETELNRYHYHLEETVHERTEELRLARDAADSANKAKSVFLANMSHELRTPLNAILGFSQLMRQDHSLSASQRQSLEIINNSGDHLLKLINDVLEIAKIEAGKLQLEIATFDLHELVREVSDMMRLRAEQKGLQLELDQSSDFPRYIKGDEARLRQILVNLVSNAVKFTNQGGVILRLGVLETAQHHLLIEVEDTGPGIGKKEQQRLFQPFEQLSGQSSKEGTGLGLAIVRQFVQLMGGEIAVTSKQGKGALFHIELPLQEADIAAVTQLSESQLGTVTGLAPGQPNYRILIAEDQQDNQILLSKLMTNLGMEVAVAANGEECVALFKQWKPDLIWMDRRMPVMDGLEATRQIRKLPGGEKVKIIAVTASAFVEQQTELRLAGMDDYVRKPYHISDVYHALARQLGLRYSFREETAPATSHGALQPEHLAALSPEQRTELREALESLDHRRIDDAIRSICDIDDKLGRRIAHLADNFDYPSILEALKTPSGK